MDDETVMTNASTEIRNTDQLGFLGRVASQGNKDQTERIREVVRRAGYFAVRYR